MFLLSNPKLIFSKGVSFVSTKVGPHRETLVWAKAGFKSNEKILDFPRKLGGWEGYDWSKRKSTELRETLGANVFLMRTYRKPGLSSPVFFLIVQAKHSSALHRPPVCYRALGYLVKDEGEEPIELKGEGKGLTGGVVSLRKLEVSRIEGNKPVERRLVLYCYLKGNQFTEDTINLVRFSTLVPISGSAEEALGELKEFAGLALPYLFEFREYRSEMLFSRLAAGGPGGWLLILLALGMPTGLILFPFLQRGRD